MAAQLGPSRDLSVNCRMITGGHIIVSFPFRIRLFFSCVFLSFLLYAVEPWVPAVWFRLANKRSRTSKTFKNFKVHQAQRRRELAACIAYNGSCIDCTAARLADVLAPPAGDPQTDQTPLASGTAHLARVMLWFLNARSGDAMRLLL